MRTVVITGASPVQVLDVTGPLEVFSSVPGYQLELGIRREIRCSERIADWGGPIDTLVIAGGPGSAGGVYDKRFPRVDREAAERDRGCVWLQDGGCNTAHVSVSGCSAASTYATRFKRCANTMHETLRSVASPRRNRSRP